RVGRSCLLVPACGATPMAEERTPKSRRAQEQERVREVLAALGGSVDEFDRAHETSSEQLPLAARVDRYTRLQSPRRLAAATAAASEAAEEPPAVQPAGELRAAPAPPPAPVQASAPKPARPKRTRRAPRVRPALRRASLAAVARVRGGVGALLLLALGVGSL